MAIFQDCITKFYPGTIKFRLAHNIKKYQKVQKKSFTYKTGFSFKDLTQNSKSSLTQLVTLNDLVDTLDIFTKRLIH